MARGNDLHCRCPTDSQTQADAARAATGIGAEELLEDSFFGALGNPGAIVGDLDLDGTVNGAGVDLDGCASRTLTVGKPRSST